VGEKKQKIMSRFLKILLFKSDRNQLPLKNVREYFYHLFREIYNKRTLFVTLIIGLGISAFLGSFHWTAFAVPFLVLSVSRAFTNFHNRHIRMLLQLPSQREDPTFIMGLEGKVVLSTGKTRGLFERFSITNISEFVGSDGLKNIMESMNTDCDRRESGPVEVYSEKVLKWYEVRTKPVEWMCGAKADTFLVWFGDVTVRKIYDRRQHDLLQYADWLAPNVKEYVKKKHIHDSIAAFLLSTYETVFIAGKDERGRLVGYAFKQDQGGIQKSDAIPIFDKFGTALFHSGRKSRIVFAEVDNYPSRESFESEYRFDSRVIDFIGNPIRNFIKCQENGLSIIAFNSDSRITPHETRFLDILLHLSKSFDALISLARENDEQFLQKVMGLCAAAEYSDEITGKHILRVNEYSRFIAMKMGFDDEYVETVGKVAALHDIGKVAIPELIKLPGKYTDKERRKMQMHTIYGAQIIDTMMRYAQKQDPRLVMAKNIALHHHQRFDGKGYPKVKQDGALIHPVSKNYRFYDSCMPVSGDEIPIEGLIVGLADRYDALRSRRPYKEAFSHEKTLRIMVEGNSDESPGKQWFGDKLWSVFLDHHKKFQQIYDSTSFEATSKPKTHGIV
jgi:HD-GYP domain-containing protein (c-di-GMP phosphodiesterase class II)